MKQWTTVIKWRFNKKKHKSYILSLDVYKLKPHEISFYTHVISKNKEL